MQQNKKETLENKFIRWNDDVLTRALRTRYFNEVKHTITANILNISETREFCTSKIQRNYNTVKYLVQEENGICENGNTFKYSTHVIK